LGLPIWAHAETATRLKEATVARLLSDGEEVALAGPVSPQRWRVLHTPGHVCLHEASEEVLVVGDMVAGEGTILIEPEDGDMAEYIRQLERLTELEARIALPAHGEPLDAPRAVFERYVAHRLAREAKVKAALERKGAVGASAAALVPD